MQSAAGALAGPVSSRVACSPEPEDVAARPASPSAFTPPLALCFKGRSILKVMAVEVQYSSKPYKYLHEKAARLPLLPVNNNRTLEKGGRRLCSLAVGTFDVVAGGGVEYGDAQVLVDQLPHGSAFNLFRRDHVVGEHK